MNQHPPSRRPLRRLAGPVLASVALALLVGCATSKNAPAKTGGEPAATPAVEVAPAAPPALPMRAVSVLTLSFEGLQPLATGHYEGWARFEDQAVSTGKFLVSPQGALSALNGTPISVFPLARDVAAARQIEVTIEPEGDRDGTPSGIVILRGALVAGRARLAFPVAIDGAAGAFVLASPTDEDPANEAAGVWFSNAAGTEPALALPQLTPGWVYEGWAGTQGLSFSTGRFAQAHAPDIAAPFSGPRSSPPFPGEDFVTRLPATVRPLVNLADGASTVAIAIEPDLGGVDPTGVGPFWLVILRREVPAGTPSGVAVPLQFDASVVPSGVATVG